MSLEELLCGEPHFGGTRHVSTNVLHCFVCCLILLLLATVSCVSSLAGKPHKSNPCLVGLYIAACPMMSQSNNMTIVVSKL